MPTRIEIIAAGEALTRDLINTPASDMGPADLDEAAANLAAAHEARPQVIIVATTCWRRTFP